MNRWKSVTSWIFTLSLGLSIASVTARALHAQPIQSAPAITPAIQAEIIDSVSQALNEIYVFPEVAAQMEQLMRNNLKSGAYSQLAALDEFMVRLTEDMRSVSHDLHLGARPMPPRDAAAMVEEDEAAQSRRQARWIEELRRDNFGFRQLKVLPGNIGYLELRGFIPAEYGGPTAVAALNFLANCDALIVDLRENGGGSPSMIQLISSYFFEEPQHLNSFYIRREDTTQQFWTQAYVQGPRMAETPVFVLTSGQTFSAAEEFTYNLKNLKRATIIGQTTGGGAHPVEDHWFRITDEVFVEVRVPFGRAINPISGTNWEGTGVEPDVVAPVEDALDVAHTKALESILAKDVDEERRGALVWALDGLKAHVEPAPLEASKAAEFTGRFGPRRIAWENGALFYQREDRPRYQLTYMGADRFMLEGLDFFRIQFERDERGVVTKLIGQYADGQRDENLRTADATVSERD
ncbi:MAG TPA: S41 family peptidase [candidate division Zixibacteria bacterium]|nr:S41 family peptidase [candidate division Zixibacteria bacterium]